MTNNKLRVKADKIDFIIIGTSRQRSKLGSSLRPSLIVASHHQTLYVILDFNFRKHIRDLRRIHRYISLSVAKTIPIALVTSRLDNWNSLLYNIASKDILKLECVQNCLARVVTRSPRFSHSVPLLKSLHRTWFPVQSRIVLNSALFPFFFFWRTFISLFHAFVLSPKPRKLLSSGFHVLSVVRVKIHAFSSFISGFYVHQYNSSI